MAPITTILRVHSISNLCSSCQVVSAGTGTVHGLMRRHLDGVSSGSFDHGLFLYTDMVLLLSSSWSLDLSSHHNSKPLASEPKGKPLHYCQFSMVMIRTKWRSWWFFQFGFHLFHFLLGSVVLSIFVTVEVSLCSSDLVRCTSYRWSSSTYTS